MAALDIEPRYTYEDYREWEGRWELIDGTAYAMSPAPYPRHQRIAVRIWQELDRSLACPECEVFIAPVDWKVNEETVVQPDVAIFCEETTEQFFSRVPPVVVEVLSPATAHKDVTVKFDLYEREGVRWYIIVDPDREIAEVYERVDGRFGKKARIESAEEVQLHWSGCHASIDFANVFGR